MPFWKKMFNKRQGVYYPRAVACRNPGFQEFLME